MATRAKIEKLEGDKALLMSVIELALKDLRSNVGNRKHEAIQYIFWSQEFLDVCDLTELDAQALREGAAKRIRGTLYNEYDRRGRRKPI